MPKLVWDCATKHWPLGVCTRGAPGNTYAVVAVVQGQVVEMVPVSVKIATSTAANLLPFLTGQLSRAKHQIFHSQRSQSHDQAHRPDFASTSANGHVTVSVDSRRPRPVTLYKKASEPPRPPARRASSDAEEENDDGDVEKKKEEAALESIKKTVYTTWASINDAMSPWVAS
uniref:START domain-containing protein n=1 Tax=Steinernema glaseri TaxID=37863 RepID=A0A1I7YZU2_9BILA